MSTSTGICTLTSVDVDLYSAVLATSARGYKMVQQPYWRLSWSAGEVILWRGCYIGPHGADGSIFRVRKGWFEQIVQCLEWR